MIFKVQVVYSWPRLDLVDRTIIAVYFYVKLQLIKAQACLFIDNLIILMPAQFRTFSEFSRYHCRIFSQKSKSSTDFI